MAFTRFNTKPKEEKKSSDGVTTIIQAEKLFQIAVLLPATTVVGWFAGHWIDGKLNQHWIGVTGMLVGGVLGMVYVIRLAMQSFRESDARGEIAKDDEPEEKQ
jgi:F0F1-type ATP synthase assembly protein I